MENETAVTESLQLAMAMKEMPFQMTMKAHDNNNHKIFVKMENMLEEVGNTLNIKESMYHTSVVPHNKPFNNL